MNKYIIHGGRPLMGEVTISGAKNAAVAIIPAALLVDGVCRIENIPQISDVTLLFSILEELGARVRVLNRHTVEIDSRHVHSTQPSFELVRRIRASYYLLGALLGRFGKATVAMPGGCNFGVRPIDQHVKGFRAMGAEVTEGNLVQAVAKGGRLTGAAVYLDMVSVGATMNIMMAAALAEGTTTIENAAKEPHIVDLANFLNSMGADIKGAGTDSIRIRGVEKLNGRPFGKDYFDELLERIREIRASERRAYQKIADVFEQCSYDYDKNSETTKAFYAFVQNKLHYAVTGMTAAELISERATLDSPTMGLTTWKGAPDGKILKSDTLVAKNYLNEKELAHLNRLVTMFIDYAELMAEDEQLMSMQDWLDETDRFLTNNRRKVLNSKGHISREAAAKKVGAIYEEFRKKQDAEYISEFDREMAKYLKGGEPD